MSDHYNPIVRMFGRYRKAVCESERCPRDHVKPAVQLETLIPLLRRRSAWAALRATGLRVPPLELSSTGRRVCTLLGLTVVGGIGLATGRWWPAALAIVPVGSATFLASRPWAMTLPPYIRTVGELVVYGTRFHEHAGSGYRWSHGDVTMKVRLVVAEALHLPIERVRPETTFDELESC